ncbi:SMC-Scp complex subunit ScpB [Oceanospirillum sediminis]|nr:SMC-Scp complex subunit ScpB [Oceanospirillum sediminis]
MKADQLKPVVEALLMVADQPLSIEQLAELFEEYERPARSLFREVLNRLQQDYDGRGIELVEVASGWRIQARPQYASRISRLWQERPQKYSRALLETLALIAYRQPVTRGDIEEIRGVSVSSSIMKTLLEREWVRVVGHREVPGRPAMYATTRNFLDYFNLQALDQLPTLSEIRDLGDQMQAKQQEEIAAEEARLMAEQEEKRRQMMAETLADGADVGKAVLTDDAVAEVSSVSDDEAAGLTVADLLQREYGRADAEEIAGSEAEQNSSAEERPESSLADSGISRDQSVDSEADTETEHNLSFSELAQRLDQRLSDSEYDKDNPLVSAQDLPPIPDPDE